jgi:hypothetical protein
LLGANVGKCVGEVVGVAVDGALVGAAVGAALGGTVPKQLAHEVARAGQLKNWVAQTPHTSRLVTTYTRALTSVMLQSSIAPRIGVNADAVNALVDTSRFPNGAYRDW